MAGNLRPSLSYSEKGIIQVGRKKLPWFKVQHRITSHPKFRSLTDTLQAGLIKLLCCAAEYEHDGLLPDIKRIAYHLGDTYIKNPTRIYPRIIQPLIERGWIDIHKDTSIHIHQWEWWQRSDAGTSKPYASPPAEPPAELPAGSLSDESSIEPFQLTAQYDVDRDLEIKNIGILRIPNACGVLDDEIQGTSKTQVKKKKEVVSDPRLLPLKDFICTEWQSLRGISNSHITPKDWVQVVAMLKRTSADSECTLQALQVSFTRFAGSVDKWDLKQGIAYWAANTGRYMQAKSNGSKDIEIGDYRLRSKEYTDKELRWWEA